MQSGQYLLTIGPKAYRIIKARPWQVVPMSIPGDLLGWYEVGNIKLVPSDILFLIIEILDKEHLNNG